jgi:hypothetical protein
MMTLLNYMSTIFLSKISHIISAEIIKVLKGNKVRHIE